MLCRHHPRPLEQVGGRISLEDGRRCVSRWEVCRPRLPKKRPMYSSSLVFEGYPPSDCGNLCAIPSA